MFVPITYPAVDDAMPASETAEAASTSTWDTILDTKESDEEKRDVGTHEGQQVESGTLPEEASESITTVLLTVIANEVKQQVENALNAIMDIA